MMNMLTKDLEDQFLKNFERLKYLALEIIIDFVVLSKSITAEKIIK